MMRSLVVGWESCISPKKAHYSPHPFRIEGWFPMLTNSFPLRLPTPRSTYRIDAKKAADYESLALLVETSIPTLKRKKEREFYRKVVQDYRAAARNILRTVR